MANGESPEGPVRRVPHTSVSRILAHSIRLFHPKREIQHPVMFTVYVMFWFLLVVTLFPQAFPDIDRSYSASYYLAITLILFLTLWFSHLSEAIAEAQGKAQADALREVRSGIRARQVLADGKRIWVGAELLRVGDTLEVVPGEVIPLDGDVILGAAQIDESMMTGESALVTREMGGDKTSVLGGTHVVQGTVQIRVTAIRGQSFLDRLIRLVEAANREKTPNELALDTILAAFTIALLIVVLTFLLLIASFSYVAIDVGTVIALYVCLIPTTIGALLPAIGISGINRVAKANVIAKSGKAVEAAGDLDVLILDKTGTITVGNRLAVQFIAAPDISEKELLTSALFASSLDVTPEGRSIVRLAARRGAPNLSLAEGSYRVIPFTAERRTSGITMTDGREIYKGAVKAIEAYAGALPPSLAEAADSAAREGMTPLAVAENKRIMGLVILKDVIKPGITDRLRELRMMGIRTVMCTGDNRLTALAIGRESGVDEVEAEAKPETKLAIIEREKAQGRMVAMSGDGSNDAPALAKADVGLAMNSGTGAAKEAGNMVDLDNDPTKLIEIISIGKQLLITRGALTTFSVTNDVAKYFAIIPALFVTANGGFLAGVAALNIMGLSDPHLAVLAAVLFNALIIPILIPLALYGVRFRPRSAIDLLRQNVLFYGLGGLVSAFAGIWLCYAALNWLGRQGWWQTVITGINHSLPLMIQFGGHL
ncbi:MAG: potassium-transporting ATPase subunit KdpB [Thermoplasmata archaeon]|nr:potassium-transporting ATPase subunit KdpB [Thermoplasmata archaeon]